MEAPPSASRRTYRPGSFTMGGEYFMQQVDATQSGDPSFHGGEAVFSWLITGEVRVYNTQNGDFKQVSPLRTVFSADPAPGNHGARQHCRSRQRVNLGRQVLALHAPGQLVSVGQRAPRTRLRVRIAESLWPGRQDALLPDPHSDAALGCAQCRTLRLSSAPIGPASPVDRLTTPRPGTPARRAPSPAPR